MRKNLLAVSVATMVAGLGMAAAAAVETVDVQSMNGPLPSMRLGGGWASSASSQHGGRRGRGMAAKRAAQKRRNVIRHRKACRG